MSDLTPTYKFEGDEVFAIHEGKVIASGKADELDSVEQTAVDYLQSLGIEREAAATADRKRKATHIVTPNGLKGQILGRTPDTWGQITVRFENGHIAHFDAHGEGVQFVTEKTASTAENPAAALEERLAADFDRGKAGLRTRLNELASIAQEATRLARAGAPYSVEVKLDSIRTAALAEAAQVKEAADYLESADAEAFAPPAPYRMEAVEQAGLGRAADDDWLAQVEADMIAENEGTDYEQLLSEGPELLVSDLDAGALADAGTTREMALAHVMARTAGYEGDEVESYREQFLARTESARRAALAERKETTKREAAVEHEASVNAPDEALFM